MNIDDFNSIQTSTKKKILVFSEIIIGPTSDSLYPETIVTLDIDLSTGCMQKHGIHYNYIGWKSFARLQK